jgi:hypothetical protein
MKKSSIIMILLLALSTVCVSAETLNLTKTVYGGAENFSWPANIAISNDGHVSVLERAPANGNAFAIDTFDQNGVLVNNWSAQFQAGGTYGMTADNNYVFVSWLTPDPEYAPILGKFNKTTGELISTLLPTTGKIYSASAMSIEDNLLYVYDICGCIHKFDLDGNFIATYGNDSLINLPEYDLINWTCSENGGMSVCNQNDPRRFTTDFPLTFGETIGFYVKDGTIYFAGGALTDIYTINATDGSNLQTWKANAIRQNGMFGIAVDNAHNVYVTDTISPGNPDYVLKYDSSKNLVANASSGADFRGLAVNPSGTKIWASVMDGYVTPAVNIYSPMSGQQNEGVPETSKIVTIVGLLAVIVVVGVMLFKKK